MSKNKSGKIPFSSIKKIIIPVVNGVGINNSLKLAEAMGSEIMLVGLIALDDKSNLTQSVGQARLMRKELKKISRKNCPVLVSHQAWDELKKMLLSHQSDLLIINWESIVALHITPDEVFASCPCDVCVIRGDFPHQINRILVPMRGGPFAEFALRTALCFNPPQITALHLHLTGAAKITHSFLGLSQIIHQFDHVNLEYVETDDILREIIRRANQSEVVILGAATQNPPAQIGMGHVATQIANQATGVVLIVRTQQHSSHVADAIAGTGAVSLVVDKWFAENTFHAEEFKTLERLLTLKQQQNLSISLALPALNEEKTVEKVIKTIQQAMMTKVPLIDEIVLIDSNSTDQTRELAGSLGVPVYIHQQILPQYGARRGKGEALWKSLLVTKGDIVAWIDTDIVNIHPRFVYGIIGPLLINPSLKFVKGFYRRPLNVNGRIQAGGGGRVTELTARPLINLFYPELSGVIQPLSGEYAGRRSALERCTFTSGYGVETSLLIDIFEMYGLSAIAQVDLLERIHHNQSLEALSKMSFAIIQTVMRKLERRYERAFVTDVNKSIKLPQYSQGDYFLHVEEIAELDRPPMIYVKEYVEKQIPNPLQSLIDHTPNSK